VPKGAEGGRWPDRCKISSQGISVSSYLQRTEWNVRDSDATVLFSLASELTDGSKKTVEFAKKHRKPWIHLDAGKPAQNPVDVLNVAGPRASKEPGIANFIFAPIRSSSPRSSVINYSVQIRLFQYPNDKVTTFGGSRNPAAGPCFKRTCTSGESPLASASSAKCACQRLTELTTSRRNEQPDADDALAVRLTATAPELPTTASWRGEWSMQIKWSNDSIKGRRTASCSTRPPKSASSVASSTVGCRTGFANASFVRKAHGGAEQMAVLEPLCAATIWQRFASRDRGPSR
jgi:hypothetical protein